MKIEIKETNKEAEIKYPCLMISEKGRIVYFTSHGSGMQLNNIDDGDSKIHWSDRWEMSIFRKFHGTITLSND